MSVVAGRENNILSCSTTTRCSAAELAENFFFFPGGGISCYVDLCALSAWLHHFPNVEEEAVDLYSPF